MNALEWLRSKATETVTVETLGGRPVEITARYFRGNLPPRMVRELRKLAGNMVNGENEMENYRLGGRNEQLEYWHTTYRPL